MTQPGGTQPAQRRPSTGGAAATPEGVPARAYAIAASASAVGGSAGRDGLTVPGDHVDSATGVDVRQADGSTEDFQDLPEATIARLPEYLRALHSFAEAGYETVSSDALAAAAGVNSAKLRKDLSHLGSYGTRGVGYEVSLLVEQIESVLGLTERRAVALVGVGNLGHALAGYAGFGSRGFRFAALLDADPTRVGERINGLVVHHIDEIDSVVYEHRINIAVIATPVLAAQEVADRLVAAGVTSILNFAPCVLAVPEGVDVRKVDLAVELQILSFHERRKALTGATGAQPIVRTAANGSGGLHRVTEADA